MKSLKTLSVVLSLAAATAMQATAINFLASADGLTPSGAYFTGTGGSVVVATKNTDVTFVGISGGAAGSEIDLKQSLTVNFYNPEVLSSLSLALLFNGPEYDDSDEIAAAKTSTGDIYKLMITGESSAAWYLNNVFLSPVVGFETFLGGDGLFTISNPFGSSAVESFTLYPMNSFPAPGGSNSDFGLFAFSTVPDAGSTLALMGVALLGLAGFARRSRR